MSKFFKTLSSHLPLKIFSVDQLSVHLYPSDNELAQKAAIIAKDYLKSVIIEQGSASIILATGSSQIQFLKALTAMEDLNWSVITCFHLDEYLGIDRNHPASFRRYLSERVENLVHPQVFHYIQGDTLQPLDECHRYTQLLNRQPIDLCCLGIGNNGHLAFNEPSVANFEDPHSVKIVKLDADNRQQQVNGGHFPSIEAVPQYAFTLTLPMICSAKKLLCLAPQKHKASIIQTMLQDPINPQCPASILRKTPHATLFLDIESASLLSTIS